MKTLLVMCAAVGIASGQSPSMTETKTINGKTIAIKYASPRVNGRAGKLFGKDGLIGSDKTYPAWRAGANSATALHTDGDLQIGSLAVPKGDYTLFVDIADENHWQFIVNKQTGQWGLDYDKSQDLGRVKMTMSKPAAPIEDLKYTLTSEGGSKGKLTLEWESHIAAVEFTAK